MFDGCKSQCKGPGVGMRENNSNKMSQMRAPALESDLSDRLCLT